MFTVHVQLNATDTSSTGTTVSTGTGSNESANAYEISATLGHVNSKPGQVTTIDPAPPRCLVSVFRRNPAPCVYEAALALAGGWG
jgi:hypothetical protein